MTLVIRDEQHDPFRHCDARGAAANTSSDWSCPWSRSGRRPQRSTCGTPAWPDGRQPCGDPVRRNTLPRAGQAGSTDGPAAGSRFDGPGRGIGSPFRACRRGARALASECVSSRRPDYCPADCGVAGSLARASRGCVARQPGVGAHRSSGHFRTNGAWGGAGRSAPIGVVGDCSGGSS